MKKTEKTKYGYNHNHVNSVIVFTLLILIATNTFAVLYTFFYLHNIEKNYSFVRKPVVEIPYTKKFKTINFTEEHGVEIYVPAVNDKGEGSLVKIVVEARPGRGRTLVNVDNLLFWIDTQHSIRVAKRVAEQITGIDTSNIDLIYTVESNASVVEGPSAGAALTIATIAAVENKTINKNVTITGTINLDGTIGPVGGVLEKAKAAKSHGFKLFLVPLGQGISVYYEPHVTCEKYGMVEFCTTEYKPKKVDIGNETGIKVVEIGSVEEALKYFLK